MWAQAIHLPGDTGYLIPVCGVHDEPPSATGVLTLIITDHQGDERGRMSAWLDPTSCGWLSIRFPKGESELFKGAVIAFVGWAQDTIGPNGFSIHLAASDHTAMDFAQGCGFVEAGRTEKNGGWTVRMEHRAEKPCNGEQLILTAGPSIGPRETSYALDAARTGWNGKWNSYLKPFEQKFADYIGCKYAIATSSCTGALHLSLLALGIGPGDEVIVPDITWVATANAVKYTGATPVFADVEPETWCLDAESVRRTITPRTKAIIPVHLYGHPARMEPLMAIAKEFGLSIVEDAAPAIGAEAHGRKTGTFGQFACFSFHGAKLLVAGEGGVMVTDDEALYDRAIRLWDQGRDASRMFWISDEGWKYKMSNVQAALGLGQLERVEELVEMKRRVFSWYAEELEGVGGLKLQTEADYARSIYWMTNVQLDEGIDREAFRAQLKSKNIDSRPVFPTISQYPIWKANHAPQPTASLIAAQAINLPSGGTLRREQIAYIGRTMREILTETLRGKAVA